MLQNSTNMPISALQVAELGYSFFDPNAKTGVAGNVVTDPRGTRRVEVFDGIFMHGTLDKVSLDGSAIVDWKTNKYPKQKKNFEGEFVPVDYGMKDDWVIQLNLYRRMLEVTENVSVRELWLWRAYRGSWNRNYTFRKFAVPSVGDNDLRKRIGDHATRMQSVLRTAEDLRGTPELPAYLASIPMDGEIKHMFNDKKCPEYCSVRNECFKLAGRFVNE